MTTSTSTPEQVKNGVNVDCPARRARSAGEGAGSRAIQMARQLRVVEWHSQPLHDRQASSGSAPSSRATRRSPSRRTIRKVFASEDHAPTPVELVLSGLASCSTAGVAAIAQRRGIQLHSVKASLEADMDIQGILGIDDDVRNGFGAIRVHFDIRADASEDDIKALVAQSQKRSAVFDIITNPTDRLRHGQLMADGWMKERVS